MEKIITNLDELREACEPLRFLSKDGYSKEEVEEISNKLKEILESDKKLIAIAAPQIGIKKRLFCVRFANKIKTFINPIITKKKDSIIRPEQFSSMPGKEILLSRPKEITVIYYNDDFKYEENKFLDAAAAIFDQQLNLLDGILPDDIGLVSDIEEDGSLADLTEEELAKLISIYKQFISLKNKTYENEINKLESGESGEAYKKIHHSLRFSESVIAGRTIVGEDENQYKKLNRAQRRAQKKNRKKN